MVIVRQVWFLPLADFSPVIVVAGLTGPVSPARGRPRRPKAQRTLVVVAHVVAALRHATPRHDGLSRWSRGSQQPQAMAPSSGPSLATKTTATGVLLLLHHRRRPAVPTASFLRGTGRGAKAGRGRNLGSSVSSSSNGTAVPSLTSDSEKKGPIIMEIPVDHIRRPLMRTRANDPDKVQELMDSIRVIGLQVPIDVLEVDGVYYGFSGCHRYEAHQRLGLPTIRCKVRRGTKETLRHHMR